MIAKRLKEYKKETDIKETDQSKEENNEKEQLQINAKGERSKGKKC